ncbi:ankyrin repeat domain-containing protein [Ferdinandcohnia quinoae]|uniref:Ankyrin repeat domain-containing protein n=1 Tax=Fredinandcohnia quinoae TaxID=2918902 RepID=A0AAW5ECD9_9BACI|nr:ankyrin repeat domain-containing protein [Fredinandcohnia sp. SECRCQ15]MCH1626439.1 ankyrin repeat domain-containing protein [Fredinandcohnia sp. SECRCQ15]
MSQTEMVADIFKSAQKNDTAELARLLEENPNLANTENSDGLLPLGYAAHFGNKEAVQVLLDYGADVDAISHSKIEYIPSNTALHAAIAGERSMDVIQLLLKSTANTNLFDSNSHTCLHSAAFHDDNIELIQLLLDYGADVHAKVEGGETALQVAETRGNNKVVQFLKRME